MAAEQFEDAGHSTAHGNTQEHTNSNVDGSAVADVHNVDAGAWAPTDGWERAAFTTLATVGTSFGLGLILLGAMILADARIDARHGLMWGAAAFAATGLAPALGLSPELPGAAAADLIARQLWWFGTALATSAGLFLTLRDRRASSGGLYERRAIRVGRTFRGSLAGRPRSRLDTDWGRSGVRMAPDGEQARPSAGLTASTAARYGGSAFLA